MIANATVGVKLLLWLAELVVDPDRACLDQLLRPDGIAQRRYTTKDDAVAKEYAAWDCHAISISSPRA